MEPDAHRRAVAADSGCRTLDPRDGDVVGLRQRVDRGAGAAVAFEVSGSAGGVHTATDVLAVRGRLVMVAIHPTPREVDLHRFFWRELTYRRPGLPAGRLRGAVELLADGDVPADELIPAVVPLDAGRRRVRGAGGRRRAS